MNEGFGRPNSRVSENEQLRRQLEQANRDIMLLRKVLAQIRPGLITNKHKQAVDKALKIRPPS